METLMSWAYDKYMAVFTLDEINGEPAVGVKSYKNGVNDIEFDKKRNASLLDAVVEAFRLVIAIRLITEYEDYYFPEDY